MEEVKKDIKLNFWRRNLRPLLEYWAILAVPFIIIITVTTINGVTNNSASNTENFLGILSFPFLLLVAPFLFIVFYKSAKPDKSEKIKFILLGLVAPYIFIFAYIATLINRPWGDMIR